MDKGQPTGSNLMPTDSERCFHGHLYHGILRTLAKKYCDRKFFTGGISLLKQDWVDRHDRHRIEPTFTENITVWILKLANHSKEVKNEKADQQ